MKSASTLALLMAAGLSMSVAPASAADLGGNCCADLEERVAELEATTVRKGNRKVSLTLSGQVNRAIMMWDDGFNRNTYYGIDNTNSSTRFSLTGSAKINADWSAGYAVIIDLADKARTFTVSNDGGAEDGVSGTGGGANGDYLLRVREANWWIQNERVGRVTVGRLTTSGAVAGIDLAGVQVVASSAPGCNGGSLFFRDAVTGATTRTMNALSDGCGYPTTRNEGIKWTSPTWQGFVVSASVAESASVERYQAPAGNALNVNDTGFSTTGSSVGVDLKYAGEFNGVRVAFGLGWERFEGNGDGVLNNPNSGFTVASAGDLLTLQSTNFGAAGSLLHVPTGLFVNADWMRSRHTTATDPTERAANRWLVQAGVTRNWFGIGNTVLFGEVGRASDWLFARRTNAAAGDELSWWGLGAIQNIDAAAMDLYLGYRSFSAEGVVTNGVKDIDILTAGARIKF